MKTTMRCHFPCVKKTIIKRKKVTNAAENVKKRNPSALLVGIKIGAATMENSTDVPQEIKNRTAIWSSHPLQGVYPKEMQSPSGRYLQTILLQYYSEYPRHGSTVNVQQQMKELKTVVCKYTMEYYSVLKKKTPMPFVTAWMKLEGIMLSKVSQRKTNTAWYHFCGI